MNPFGSKTGFFRKTVGNVTVPTWRMKVLVWVLPTLFVAAGLLWIGSNFVWMLGAVETEGTVTKVYTWEAENAVEAGSTLYGPVFAYTWTDGSETEGALGMSSPEYNFEIGSRHSIMYNPTTKGNVRFAGFSFNYFGGVLILAIGLVFSLASLALWIWVKALARKRDQKEA